MKVVGSLAGLFLAAVSAQAQVLETIDPERAARIRAEIAAYYDSAVGPLAVRPGPSKKSALPGAAVADLSCVVPYETFVPTDEEIEEAALVPLTDYERDPALADCDRQHEPSLRKSAGVSQTTSGWTINTAQLREFRDSGRVLIFNVAPARDKYGRQGVLVSRGAVKVANGRSHVVWTRRVLTVAALTEFDVRLKPKLSWNDIEKFFEKLWKEAQKWLREKFPQYVAKAIESLAKRVEKWVASLMIDLLGPGKSGPTPPTFMAQMQNNNASDRAVEEYLATIDTVRTMNYTLSDKVFLALSAPVTRTGDRAAALSLAKTIDQLK